MPGPEDFGVPSDNGVFSATAPVFTVTSVDKIETPMGEQGRQWYRYVLKSSTSTITGCRSGSRGNVLEYATQCAEQLNARLLSSVSIWAPRGRKPAAAK